MTEVRVCEEWFPNGVSGKPGFLMEKALKDNLDFLLKNIIKDWDFTIIISGGGEVRLGKSMLAMQIACYWAYQVEKVHKNKVCFNLKDNFVFTGANLIKKGHYLGTTFPYSPLIFDEAGADLEGRKVMSSTTKMALDYFRECGQYNLLNILVIPEFFDLPRGIAMSRSIFLIDVKYSADIETGTFRRGYFRFFNRKKKKYLYLNGKRTLNYNASTYNFHGRFYKFYTIPEEEYRLMKQNALIARDTDNRPKAQRQRDAAIKVLRYDYGLKLLEIRDLINKYGVEIGRNTISYITKEKPLEKVTNSHSQLPNNLIYGEEGELPKIPHPIAN